MTQLGEPLRIVEAPAPLEQEERPQADELPAPSPKREEEPVPA